MAGGKELGFVKTAGSVRSLKEQVARTTLRNVRAGGHPYVELRKDGKKVIFFCTLCMARCYGESALSDHLKGNLHAKMYAAAERTLLKPNPWPFNDGKFFFHDSSDEDENSDVGNANQVRKLDAHSGGDDDLALFARVVKSRNTCDVHGGQNERVGDDAGFDSSLSDKNLNGNRRKWDLVIPGVLFKNKVVDLEAGLMGVGKIAARFCEKDESSSGIIRIWCEWLGKDDFGDNDGPTVQKHDFAVVVFTYTYNLGRHRFLDDVNDSLSSSPQAKIEHIEGARKKRKESHSDPEDIRQSLRNLCEASKKDSQSSNIVDSRSLLAGHDDHVLESRVASSKTKKRKVRERQKIGAERSCRICEHEMFPGKDVATLLNTKTGRFICSSRNVSGSFHVFHISCLLYWILICEYELLTRPSDGSEVKRTFKRKSGTECNEVTGTARKPIDSVLCPAPEVNKRKSETKGKEVTGTARKPIDSVSCPAPEVKKIKCETKGKEVTCASNKSLDSVFCPECRGTGINVKGDELEAALSHVTEIYRSRMKMFDAHRQWMKTPEVLPNCSTGLDFRSSSEEILQGKVLPLKLLHFYHANESKRAGPRVHQLHIK